MYLPEVLASMETSYSMHGHTRSLSSIASSILPLQSDASTHTSMTASPMDPHDPGGGLMEFDLPPSSKPGMIRDDVPEKAHLVDIRGSLLETATGNIGSREPMAKDHIDPGIPDGHLQKSLPSSSQHGQAPNVEVVPPKELLQLVTESLTQGRRASHARATADVLALSYGLDKRLSKSLWVTYGNLIDQYKIEDQAGFGGLYEAYERLSANCQRFKTARSSSLHAVNGIPASIIGQSPEASLIEGLVTDDKRTILGFLSQIRSDQDYLAGRITSLSPTELTALTSSYHPAGIDLSILANHSYGATDLYSQDSQMMKLSRRMDNLQLFHIQDPFFILIHCCFDASARIGSNEYCQRNAIWSSVCAQVIMTSKAGSDEFIIAATDAFLSFEEWKLKSHLELYLMDILDKGAILFGSSAEDLHNGGVLEQKEEINRANKERDFFDSAVKDLLSLLATDLKIHFLPRPVLDFIRSVLLKLPDPTIRLKAKIFFVTRWYFASLLSSILMYPELHGLTMTQHISQTARRSIVNEIVVRMQVQVFDVLDSRIDDPLAVQTNRAQIMSICDCFEPIHYCHSWEIPEPSQFNMSSQQDSEDRIMLSSHDVLTLIQALYPLGFAEDPSSDQNPPSTTSSSTLRPGSSDLSSRSSETDPVYSGTTIMTEDILLEDKDQQSTANVTALASYSENVDNDTKMIYHRSARVEESFLAKLKSTLQEAIQAAIRRQGDLILKDWCIFRSSHDGSLSMAPSPSAHLVQQLDSQDVLDLYPAHGSLTDLRIVKGLLLKLLNRFSVSQQGYLSTVDFGDDHSAFLESLFEDAVQDAQLEFDVEASHFWWRASSVYNRIKSASDGPAKIKNLLFEIMEELRQTTRSATRQAELDDLRVRILCQCEKRQKASLEHLEKQCKALRIKMWYASEVRHSSTYEEAQLIAQALRAMQNVKRRQTSSTFNWARQRLKGNMSQDRAIAQTKEAISAPSAYGDCSKLADDQVEMVSNWMTRGGVENFCKGEEKIHRFCYQIQKSVDKLAGPTLVDSPVLWSSNLFRREKAMFESRPQRQKLLPKLPESTRFLNQASYDLQARNLSPLVLSQVPSYASSVQGVHASSLDDTKQDRNTVPLNSDFGSSSQTLASSGGPGIGAIAMPSYRSHNSENQHSHSGSSLQTTRKSDFIKGLRRALYGLLISDLEGSAACSRSETDIWMSKCLELDESNDKMSSPVDTVEIDSKLDDSIMKDQQNQQPSPHGQPLIAQIDNLTMDPRLPIAGSIKAGHEFPFDSHYRELLQRMSLAQDPLLKLQICSEFENLAIKHAAQRSSLDDPLEASELSPPEAVKGEGIEAILNIPRTKATRLQEVIANCHERRAKIFEPESICFNRGNQKASSRRQYLSRSDAVIDAMLKGLRDSRIRPETLFRDLQYIAAFVPPSTLDGTSQGRAFWTVAIAALVLKAGLCQKVIQRASAVTEEYISSRNTQPQSHSRLQDAANLWTVAAKEGSPVAARELGLSYLTHPDLIPRTTMPFSKAKDTFQSSKAGDNYSLPSVADTEKEHGALDPQTFAVVFHWMEVAANGGDEEAKAFLRQGGTV